MDFINRQQPEQSHADLFGPDAVRKVQEIAGKAETCFFCTDMAAMGSSGSRPMAVQRVDDAGHLWFLSASESHKNEEVALDPVVRLYFQAAAHSGFLTLTGAVAASRDQAKIEDLWKPIMKTWFTEGEHDPRITVLKFTPKEGCYWDTKHGRAVAGIKMLVGAAIGKTLDDSVEGRRYPSLVDNMNAAKKQRGSRSRESVHQRSQRGTHRRRLPRVRQEKWHASHARSEKANKRDEPSGNEAQSRNLMGTNPTDFQAEVRSRR